MERARARRPVPARRISPAARTGLLLGGALLVVAGALLLAAGGPQTAARLGRLAGLLIVIGLVAAGIGLIGRL